MFQLLDALGVPTNMSSQSWKGLYQEAIQVPITLVQNNAQAAEDDEDILGKEEDLNEGFYTDVKGAIEKVHVLFDV